MISTPVTDKEEDRGRRTYTDTYPLSIKQSGLMTLWELQPESTIPLPIVHYKIK